MFRDEVIKNQDIDTLKRWLLYKFVKLGGYRIAMKEMLKGSLLYRGVCCQQRPNIIRRISYPPPGIVRLQRMNRPGQPRFYFSAGPQLSVGRIPPAAAAAPVFFELRARQGDRIALSAWEVTEPLLMYNLGYHAQALRQMGAQRHNAAMRPQMNHLKTPK